MIEDARLRAAGTTFTGDVCVVGAGAAGISLALDLADAGHRVLLLEAGGFEDSPETQALYQGEVADERLHSPPHTYRQRRFGGSTTIWGGRCTPLDPIDFERRAYVPFSGWPIRFEDLRPHYIKANALCEAGDFIYSARETFGDTLRPVIPGFCGRNYGIDALERFSCPTDFGRRYRRHIERSEAISCLVHANVTCINLDPRGQRVESLDVRTLAGAQMSAVATHYVLATGGLEVARLLLASRAVAVNGIGNETDQVGRYYMCHLAGSIGTIELNMPPDSVHHGYDVSDEGIYCRRRFALMPEAQRANEIGNFIARLHHPDITDPRHGSGILSLLFLARPFIPYEYAKRLHGNIILGWTGFLRHCLNVLCDMKGTVTFLWNWLRKRVLATRKFPSIVVTPRRSIFNLDFHAEQHPNPDSRLTLSAQVDALGMPRLRIDWRYTHKDLADVRKALDLFKEDLADSGVGRFEFNPGNIETDILRYGAYGGHHIGTARMSDSPREGVVDRNCKIHGCDNLFVASAAVFPTSGQANPTLTIVALALRLGAHLRSML